MKNSSPNILRVQGEYGKLPMLEMVDRLRKTYGDIVRLEGIPGRRRCVFLFDPNDCEKVYRTEGPWPSRISMETIKLYREQRHEVYKGESGLVSSQGEEWHRFRSKVNQHLMQPRTIRPHIGPINEVADDFIERIRSIRNFESLEMPATFNNEMNKWALESMCVIAFDHRIGCLEPNLKIDSEPQLLINNVHSMFGLMYKLEILPSLWKLYKTQNLREFFRVLDNLTRITGKYVDQAKQRLAKKPVENIGDRSMLERLISVDEHTTTVMIMDMLTAGVDTTSNTATGALYHIATNRNVQEKLRKEAINVLPSKTSPVTLDVLSNIPYLKAVLKESLRLMPIAVGNLRTTNTNVAIRGYRIPKGDDLIMCHSLMSKDSKYFPNPEKFLPERWLKDSAGTTHSAKNAHPFAYMPFGFGPRTCIGRRFAQLEMETLLIKVSQLDYLEGRLYKMILGNSTLVRLTLAFSRSETIISKRSATTATGVQSQSTFDVEWKAAKPYESIPGPKPLPVLGNVLRFLPVVGEFQNISTADLMKQLRQKYGDVVKLEGIPGRRRCVFFFDPVDAEKIYRTEGSWPSRITSGPLKLYRKRKEGLFKGEYGLLPSQGEKWHQFRVKVNQYFMQPRTILPHVGPVDQVAMDFVEMIRSLRDPESLEMPATFNNEIHKWALESICVIAFDHRVGCLEPNLAKDSEPQVFINNVSEMFELMYKLEVLPSLWKLYDTRNLKKLFNILDNMTRITSKYVNQAKQRVAEKKAEDVGDTSILERLISVDEQTSTVMIMDMLLAGVDTTSTAVSGAMWCIATNPEAQEKLREEAIKVLPTKTSPVTAKTLNNIPYLRAVIKESLRLAPVAMGVLRTTNSDVVIGGYRIPKGDDVVICHGLMSLDPEHFPDNMKFLPERWLRESSNSVSCTKNAHPFVYMPFGFGPRSCIGRRFSQLEMETLLIKLVRNFRFEWHYGPLEMKNGLLNTITTPLRIKFSDI
ncbi:cytochrome P450 CYP12A2-like [Neodiprion pinetum]|uniref:cytochrome P450 CYP12A2-like n=1 Tax=Neodiprion pinetum TaxID=441929 RepID=UPI001EDD3A83|nr:cytochrome P450 CYP12A2-like [Neodiprion pinetum]